MIPQTPNKCKSQPSRVAKIRNRSGSIFTFFGLLIGCVATPLQATDDHLVLCEAVLTPTSDEFIEIANPTGAMVSLDNYYLSDDADYALLPGAFGAGPAPSIGSSDFIAQFPPGSTIDPDEVLVIAFDGAGFLATFGFAADFEIHGTDAGTPDMIATDVGASAGLTNSGENAVLFFWDGASDLVIDVDMTHLGTPSAANAIASKTGVMVDGPDGDMVASTYLNDAATMPQQATDPGFGFSTKRISLEGANETTGGGNGITGDDETTEDITITWDSTYTAPDPGICDGLGPGLPAIVINEVDADTAGTDTLEFVELFGPANEPLDGLVVVFYNGSGDTSYNAFDLDGFTLDANGFFVLGNAAVANVSIVFGSNGLQNGADAVALYLGDDTDFPNGTAVTDVDIIDAVVYDTNDGDDSGLIDVLTPMQAQINEDGAGDKDAHSNSRVPDGGTAQDTSTYVQQDPTPGASNVAPGVPEVVINEVDADTAGTDTLEFVELFGPANEPLDGLVVVFYNGSSDTSYNAFDLDGFSLDANGFFVLGNAAVANVSIVFGSNGLQNGADAVAIYQADGADFPNGTAVTATNIIDAVVYDTNDGDDSGLIDILTPGQAQLNEDGAGDKDVHSNSRVPDGGTALDTSTYVQQDATPGATNVAPSNAVIINEVDADTAGTDTLEFVELFGPANEPLDGLVLVFYNGNGDTSYNAFDLDGFSLNANGFFVLGNAAVANVSIVFGSNGLQNGADAVALYQGNASDFPNGTAVTAANIIDAVVYDTDDSDDSGLIDILTPGQAQINEAGMGNKDGHSNSRVPDGGTPLDTSTYTQQDPTPGTTNVPPPAVTINEVDADTAGTDTLEFVELFGPPKTALDGLVVVFFNGSSDTSYNAFDLDGFALDSNGFFVLGNAAVANVSIVFGSNGLQNGADAVAIYVGDATDFPNGTAVTAANIIDAVVYDTNDGDDSGLIDILTPGQPQINEDGGGDKDAHSNSRVPDGGPALDTSTYVQQDPTPGATNVALVPMAISDIQGPGLASPVEGQTVLTEGNIVTALTADGFFMQAPDVFRDGDPDTSEGLFVFTDTPPGVAVGDEVNVSGEVAEFFGLTELTNTPMVDIISSGNALPNPAVLDGSIPSPVQPQSDIELERFEGMLVQVNGGRTTAPTDGFGDTTIVAGSDLPFREPGIEFPGMPGLPIWDGNPEIFEMDPDGAGLGDELFARGATITATGPLTFSFGDYQILPTSLSQGKPLGGGFLPVPVRDREPGEFTVGSQNMFRLFDTNPNYSDRLAKFSLLIRNVLKAPDILALQEVGTIGEMQDLANQIASDDATINYTPYLIEGNDVGGIDVGFLVRDSVQVDSVTQIQPNEMFTFDGNTNILHDRPPLLLEGSFNGAARGGLGSFPIKVIAIHNRSLNNIDDPVDGPRVRFKRHTQALRISQEIQTIQTAEPDVGLIVLGDFNGFEFTDGYVDVLGQQTGNLDPLGALIMGTDEINPDLTNQVLNMPPEERYSFNFNGSAQTLDHALTSTALDCSVRGAQFGRANADYPEVLEDDPSTPLRASDHDGLVVFLEMPFITVDPVAGLITSETGTSDTFTVVLEAAPTSDVVIGVTSGDLTEGTVSPSSLTFTTANWDTPQMVTVTGVDDAVVDGDVNYLVTLAPATSADTCYNGFDPQDVSVTNQSKDSADIILTAPANPVTDENGASFDFDFVLTSEPVAQVIIPLTVSDNGEAELSTNNLVFDNTNWDTPQTVTVTGLADLFIDGDQAVTVLTGPSQSADGNYDALITGDIPFINEDVDASEDYTVSSGPGAPIVIDGPPDHQVGLYIWDPETGMWVFVENVTLDEFGQAIATTTGMADTIYGIGGLNGSPLPTHFGFLTVPTLGTWGLIFMTLLLMAFGLRHMRKTQSGH